MKESVGNAFVFGFFAFFAFLTVMILTISINYSRASKIKNRLLEKVESYALSSANDTIDGAIEVIDFDSEDFKYEIEHELASLGYRRNEGGFIQNDCELNGGDEKSQSAFVMNPHSNYKYCIYAYPTSRGYYYGVKTYMYFDIPIIGSLLEFPIYGETKVIYNLGDI